MTDREAKQTGGASPSSASFSINHTPQRMVLLGAGASADAGIPTSFKMTRRMVETIHERYPHENPARLLNYVCGRLIAHDTSDGKDPFAGIDVERLLAAIRLLGRRSELEIAPFVASWDPGVGAFARQDDPFDRPTDRFLKALWDRHPFPGRIGDELRAVIRSELKEESPHAYWALFQTLVDTLKQLLKFDEDRVEYLKPLIELARLQDGLTVITLNYDRTVEALAARHGMAYSTGFESWEQSTSLSFSGDLHLLKVHGSVDWREMPHWSRGQRHETGSFPRNTYTLARNPYSDPGLPFVIFGAGEKLRADGPFLDLFMEAKQRLALCDELVVVGYSFRDTHINHLIAEWLSASMHHRLLIIDPSFPERASGEDGEDFRHKLRRYLVEAPREQQRELAPARMVVVREYAKDGLESLLPGQDAETEHEP